MAKSPTSPARKFTKVVDGVTKTREVTTPSGETEALFEGYLEEKPAAKTSAAASTSSSGAAGK